MEGIGGLYDHLFKYSVIGPGPDSVGTVEGLWTAGDELEFLGVKTGAISYAMHLVPARVVEIDDGNRAVLIPFNLNEVMGAPTAGLHEELKAPQKARVYQYYENLRDE